MWQKLNEIFCLTCAAIVSPKKSKTAVLHINERRKVLDDWSWNWAVNQFDH